MKEQNPELESSDTPVGLEQSGSLPEQRVAGQPQSLGAKKINPIEEGGANEFSPGELEVAPVSVASDAKQATPQGGEVDPVGGARAVWGQVHQGQAVLPAAAYHKVNEVLTGLKRAPRR